MVDSPASLRVWHAYDLTSTTSVRGLHDAVRRISLLLEVDRMRCSLHTRNVRCEASPSRSLSRRETRYLFFEQSEGNWNRSQLSTPNGSCRIGKLATNLVDPVAESRATDGRQIDAATAATVNPRVDLGLRK